LEGLELKVVARGWCSCRRMSAWIQWKTVSCSCWYFLHS